MTAGERPHVVRVDVGRVVVSGSTAPFTAEEIRERIGRIVSRDLVDVRFPATRATVTRVEIREGRPAPGTPAIAGAVGAALAGAFTAGTPDG